ncbi:MAG TPA: peptidase M48 [Microscillaceae bacterium]|nr:peptidase M48 [Microscillaceae bacterium]
MATKYLLRILILLFMPLALTTCTKDGKVNIFSLQDDIRLGRQVRDQIAADPTQYPILSSIQYPASYEFLKKIRDNILNSGNVDNRDTFEWEVFIIRGDNTLNAFVTPGGYIYVYTGLIKFLDNEDQLAGVMGHEIAHADKRHSTTNLTKKYGVSLLLDVVFGRNSSGLSGIAKDIAGGLGALSFSRATESEADAFSVEYLSKTNYQCSGAAGFFQKIETQGGNSTPVWLSTHPSPDNRVTAINAKAAELGCSTTVNTNLADYQAFKDSLPQ